MKATIKNQKPRRKKDVCSKVREIDPLVQQPIAKMPLSNASISFVQISKWAVLISRWKIFLDVLPCTTILVAVPWKCLSRFIGSYVGQYWTCCKTRLYWNSTYSIHCWRKRLWSLACSCRLQNVRRWRLKHLNML